MQLSRPSERGDRGVSAVIFAIILSALLAMSAFAVDIGKVYTERRHDQNTVDAAVMSGLVEGVLGGGVVEDIVEEIRDKVDTTLGRVVAPEEWESCADSEQLHFTTAELEAKNSQIDVSLASECISFSQSFDEVRVKIPNQEVAGIFGPALGFANKSVNASANGKIVSGTGSPPFVALSTAGQGDFVCIRTSSSQEPQPLANGNGPGDPATFPLKPDDYHPDTYPDIRPDPCDSTAYNVNTSTFGTLLPWTYQGTCKQTGNQDQTIAIAIGVDHVMGAYGDGYTPGDPERVDGGNGCTVMYPNTFAVDTGFAAGELRCALVSKNNGQDSDECLGVTPRLHQGEGVQGVHKFVGENMDNTPPWSYLRSAAALAQAGMPEQCVAVAAAQPDDDYEFDSGPYAGVADSDWDHYDMFDVFTECITEWEDEVAVAEDGEDEPASSELFELEIGNSPRFAFIPKVYESYLDSSVKFVHIEGFVPAFMYRLYTSSASVMCDPDDERPTAYGVHDAGQQHSCGATNGEAKVDRIASLILACGMVPDKLCNKATQQPAGLDIYEFRLTR